MKIGILTYESLYCNFTNYGTVLQSWALMKAIRNISDEYNPILINYCPDSMRDKNPLNPIQNMWDTDSESKLMCELSMPFIEINYSKIKEFYFTKMQLTDQHYTAININKVQNEGIFKFICGSDSIWDITEFDMDRAFFADYPIMKGNSMAYAPSFQDSFLEYQKDQKQLLIKYLNNFTSIGIRDEEPLDFLKCYTYVAVKRVVDPTMLLESNDYNDIIAPRQENERYLLYYSRRYNKAMENFVDEIASKNNLKVIEISLRYKNCEKHKMFYEAGVEEFLSLIKYADFVVTNSFHCLIFALLFKKNFYVFTRAHCNNKIYELLSRLNLEDRLLHDNNAMNDYDIDYTIVKVYLDKERIESQTFLKNQLRTLCQ